MARTQALTPIKTNEVEISFYAKSRAGPSPIHAVATAGNAATAAPFPYAARAVFPSASIRRAPGRQWNGKLAKSNSLTSEVIDWRVRTFDSAFSRSIRRYRRRAT